MPEFTHHVFVCCNQREAGGRPSCDPTGSEHLRECFKREIEKRGLKPQVRANKAGCLDQCDLGPTVVIYPQGIWYGGVEPDDVPRIVEETIIGGRVLDDLVISPELLNNKLAQARVRAERGEQPG